MAAADVFVFPSLFEGSAVVTYEALACGLPCVVTPDAGSVVRDGVEGFVVAPRDVDGLAERMEQLGDSTRAPRPHGRGRPGPGEEFDWPRYHDAVAVAVDSVGRSSSVRDAPGSSDPGSRSIRTPDSGRNLDGIVD